MDIQPLSQDWQDIQGRVRPFTGMPSDQLHTLYQLMTGLNKAGIPGDVVECGVCRGGSAATLAAAIGDNERTLWLYDTFEGIPPATPEDGEKAQGYTGAFKGSMDDTIAALSAVEYSLERAKICKGLFTDTFQENLPARTALVHIDADWYDSVLLCLRTFYPRTPDGGVIVLDDFAWWEGARKAFYTFCWEFNVQPLLERTSGTSAYWIKGREHNRFSGWS